jgi:phosphoribosylformylglycinamidine synthase
MRFGIVVFPGSNCDHDCYHVLKHVLQQETRFIWHKERALGALDAVILPGGFSYGDYLRTGAIARFAPVMEEVVRFAHAGGIVIGICNGFQILCEAGLLPGVLMRNAHLRFASQQVYLKVENAGTRFTSNIRKPVLKMPIAHGDGNYFAPPEVVQQLQTNRQILFRYCTASGEIANEANPNGAAENIAGIINESGNVMGLMPHPERAAEPLLGSDDGLEIFSALLNASRN